MLPNEPAFSSNFRLRHFSVKADWQRIIGLCKSNNGPQHIAQQKMLTAMSIETLVQHSSWRLGNNQMALNQERSRV